MIDLALIDKAVAIAYSLPPFRTWRSRLGMKETERLYIGLVDCMILGEKGVRRLGKLFPADLPEIFVRAHTAGQAERQLLLDLYAERIRRAFADEALSA